MNINKMSSIKGATVTFPNGRTILNYNQEDEIVIESAESMTEMEQKELAYYVNDVYERGMIL